MSTHYIVCWSRCRIDCLALKLHPRVEHTAVLTGSPNPLTTLLWHSIILYFDCLLACSTSSWWSFRLDSGIPFLTTVPYCELRHESLSLSIAYCVIEKLRLIDIIRVCNLELPLHIEDLGTSCLLPYSELIRVDPRLNEQVTLSIVLRLRFVCLLEAPHSVSCISIYQCFNSFTSTAEILEFSLGGNVLLQNLSCLACFKVGGLPLQTLLDLLNFLRIVY